MKSGEFYFSRQVKPSPNSEIQNLTWEKQFPIFQSSAYEKEKLGDLLSSSFNILDKQGDIVRKNAVGYPFPKFETVLIRSTIDPTREKKSVDNLFFEEYTNGVFSTIPLPSSLPTKIGEFPERLEMIEISADGKYFVFSFDPERGDINRDSLEYTWNRESKKWIEGREVGMYIEQDYSNNLFGCKGLICSASWQLPLVGELQIITSWWGKKSLTLKTENTSRELVSWFNNEDVVTVAPLSNYNKILLSFEYPYPKTYLLDFTTGQLATLWENKNNNKIFSTIKSLIGSEEEFGTANFEGSQGWVLSNQVLDY